MEFKERQSAGLGKFYLKLKAGEAVKGVFRGNPNDFHIHWINKQSIQCPGPEACPHCKEGKKASFRFNINFVVNENGTYVAKIFEQGWIVYDALRELHSSDYNLEKTVVKISRTGSGMDTTYSVIPLPNGAVTPDMEAKLAAVQLHDLNKLNDPANQVQADSGPDFNSDDIPF